MPRPPRGAPRPSNTGARVCGPTHAWEGFQPDTRAITGGALGLLGMAVGLSKLPVFLHGVVLSVLPSNLARAVVALTIAAGAAATCLGLVIFSAALESPEDEGA